MKKVVKPLLLTVLLILASILVFSQGRNPDDETSSGTRFVSAYSLYLSIGVLLFGLLIVFFEFILIKNRLIDSANSIKILMVSLIITGTLFLITAGYTPDQISPALGLLGTIAGYILGKTELNSGNKTNSGTTSDATPPIPPVNPTDSSAQSVETPPR